MRKYLDFFKLCKGCWEVETDTQYCITCLKEGKIPKCHHGEMEGQCNKCDIESDLAYDASKGN